MLQMHDADLMRVLDDVERGLDSLLDRGPRTLVVDMSGVARLSSTTIAALLWVRRRCAARGVDVVVREASTRHLAQLRRIGLRDAPALQTMAPGAGSPRTVRWSWRAP